MSKKNELDVIELDVFNSHEAFVNEFEKDTSTANELIKKINDGLKEKNHIKKNHLLDGNDIHIDIGANYSYKIKEIKVSFLLIQKKLKEMNIDSNITVRDREGEDIKDCWIKLSPIKVLDYTIKDLDLNLLSYDRTMKIKFLSDNLVLNNLSLDERKKLLELTKEILELTSQK